MIGRLDKNSNQRLVIYNKNKISPTLQAAMGNGGGNVPLIIKEIINGSKNNSDDGQLDGSHL